MNQLSTATFAGIEIKKFKSKEKHYHNTKMEFPITRSESKTSKVLLCSPICMTTSGAGLPPETLQLMNPVFPASIDPSSMANVTLSIGKAIMMLKLQ